MSDNIIEIVKDKYNKKAFNFGKDLIKEEKNALILACKNGDEDAFEILCNGLMGLIKSFINEKAWLIIRKEVCSFDELVNTFKDVLSNCVIKFDIDKGVDFVSYYYSAIRNKLSHIYNKAKNSIEFNAVSLDDKIGGKKGDDDRSYGDFLADKSDETVNFEQRVLDKFVLEKYLNLLPDMYMFIVESYYFKQLTMQKIGDKLNFSKENIRIMLNDIIELFKYLMESKDNCPDFSKIKDLSTIKKIIKFYEKLPNVFDILEINEVLPLLNNRELEFIKYVCPKYYNGTVDDKLDKKIVINFKTEEINLLYEKLCKIRDKKVNINEILYKYGEDLKLFKNDLDPSQKLFLEEYLLKINFMNIKDFCSLHNIPTNVKSSIFLRLDKLKNNKKEIEQFVNNNGGYLFLTNFFSASLNSEEVYIFFNYILDYKRNNLDEISAVLNKRYNFTHGIINKINYKLDVFFGRVVKNRFYNGKRIDNTRYSLVERRSNNIKSRIENLKNTDNLTLDDISACFSKLSKNSQDILIHYIINGYSKTRIAKILDIDKKNVYVRFESAKLEVYDLLSMDYNSLPDNQSVEEKSQMAFRLLYADFVKKLDLIDYKNDLYPSLDEKYRYTLDNFLQGRGDKLLSQEAKELGVTKYSKILKYLGMRIDKILLRKKEIEYFYKKYGGKEIVEDFRSIIDDKGKIVLDNYVLSFYIDAYARTKKLINSSTYNIIAKRDWIFKTFDELEEKKEKASMFIAEHGGKEYLEDFAETLIPKQQIVLNNYLMDYHYLTMRELENKFNFQQDYIISAIADIMSNYKRYAKRRADIDALIESAGGREVVNTEFRDKLKEIQKFVFEKSVIAYNPMIDKDIAELMGKNKPTITSLRNIVTEKFKRFCLAKSKGFDRVVPIKYRSRKEFIDKYGKDFLLNTFAPSALTEIERAVLENVMVNNMKYDEYALVSGMSNGNIHARMVIIKKKLEQYEIRKAEVDSLIENAGGEDLVAEKLFKNLSEAEQIIFVNSIVSYFPDQIGALMKKANVSKQVGYYILEYLKYQIELLTKEKENYNFMSYEEYKAAKKQKS